MLPCDVHRSVPRLPPSIGPSGGAGVNVSHKSNIATTAGLRVRKAVVNPLMSNADRTQDYSVPIKRSCPFALPLKPWIARRPYGSIIIDTR